MCALENNNDCQDRQWTERKQQESDRLEKEINTHNILQYNYSTDHTSAIYQARFSDIWGLVWKYALNAISDKGAEYALNHSIIGEGLSKEERADAERQAGYCEHMSNLVYQRGKQTVDVVKDSLIYVLNNYDVSRGDANFAHLFMKVFSKLRGFANAANRYGEQTRGVEYYKNEEERSFGAKILKYYNESSLKEAFPNDIEGFYEEAEKNGSLKKDFPDKDLAAIKRILRIAVAANTDSLQRTFKNDEGEELSVMDRYISSAGSAEDQYLLGSPEEQELSGCEAAMNYLNITNGAFLEHAGNLPVPQLVKSIWTTSEEAFIIYEFHLAEQAKELDFFNEQAYGVVVSRFAKLCETIPADCNDYEARIDKGEFKKKAKLQQKEISMMCEKQLAVKVSDQNVSKHLKNYKPLFMETRRELYKELELMEE